MDSHSPIQSQIHERAKAKSTSTTWKLSLLKAVHRLTVVVLGMFRHVAQRYLGRTTGRLQNIRHESWRPTWRSVWEAPPRPIGIRVRTYCDNTSRVTRTGARWSPEREAAIREKNKSFAAWMLAIALGTMGLSYASVPLYRVFCQVTGFGGTVRRGDGEETDEFVTGIEEAKIVEDRPITIRFNADVSAKMPWRFTPSQAEIVVLPGETALAFYVAQNDSKQPITGIATYNVAPAKAGIYFNKVQCFCFDEQRLKPGEALDMPIFFFIDPEFAQDENMADVKDIMLSYTFFRAEDVTPEQLQQAQALAFGH